jgi:5-methylcytosine-specific restriction endonuclease McrA
MREAELRRVFSRTGGHCHFCGDSLKFSKRGWASKFDGHWEVDHVIQKGKGGGKDSDNCLPACTRCNRLRWHRTAQNIQEVLFLGVLAKKEIQNGNRLGKAFLELRKRRFLENEIRRTHRQSHSPKRK